MEEDLISKKDLLELTDISYGQLYRWKRKGLIPEDWFIRKSTFTGQETFFPRNRILSRIDKIKNMKDDISLDDLAGVFSPALEKCSMTEDELVKRNIVTQEIAKLYHEFRGGGNVFDYGDILSSYILNKLLVSGDISLEEGKTFLQVLKEGMIKFGSGPFEVILTRKLGVFQCFAVAPPCRVCTDSGSRLIAKINTASITEELKLKLL